MRGTVALLASVAMLGVVTGTASAAPSVVRAKASVEIDQVGTTTSATALCPAGREAVSGGFETLPPSANFETNVEFLVPFESRRTDNARGWKVSAALISFAGASTAEQRLTAYAYCALDPGPRKVVSASVPVNGQSAAIVRAQCPRGWHPFSGGYTTELNNGPTPEQFDFAAATTNARSGAARAWTVQMFHNQDGTATAYAYCRRNSKRPKPRPHLVRSDSRQATNPGERAVASTDTCPRRFPGASGGWSSPPPGQGGMVVWRSARISGGGWQVDATLSAGGPVTLDLTVRAYCGGLRELR